MFRVEEKKAISDSLAVCQNALKSPELFALHIPIWLLNAMKKVNVR